MILCCLTNLTIFCWEFKTKVFLFKIWKSLLQNVEITEKNSFERVFFRRVMLIGVFIYRLVLHRIRNFSMCCTWKININYVLGFLSFFLLLGWIFCRGLGYFWPTPTNEDQKTAKLQSDNHIKWRKMSSTKWTVRVVELIKIQTENMWWTLDFGLKHFTF